MLNLILSLCLLQNNINIAEENKATLTAPNFEYCQNLYFTDFTKFKTIGCNEEKTKQYILNVKNGN